MSYTLDAAKLKTCQAEADGKEFFHTPMEAVNAQLYECWRTKRYKEMIELAREGAGKGIALKDLKFIEKARKSMIAH